MCEFLKQSNNLFLNKFEYSVQNPEASTSRSLRSRKESRSSQPVNMSHSTLFGFKYFLVYKIFDTQNFIIRHITIIRE